MKANFDELQNLQQRVEVLLHRANGHLLNYWDNSHSCFFVDPCARGRVSVTTTCFASYSCSINNFIPEGRQKNDFIADVTQTILDAKWVSEQLEENNIYTAPIALSTVLYYHCYYKKQIPRLEKILKLGTAKLEAAISAVIAHIGYSNAASFAHYEPSAYLSYWSFWALKLSSELDFISPTSQSKSIQIAENLRVWSEAEVHRQIAFHASGDVSHFDAVQLSYSLALYHHSFAIACKPTNRKLVSRAIAIFFESQQDNGLWPKSHPIFHFSTLGSVHPFSFETFDVFLSFAEYYPDDIRDCFNQLIRLVSWAEQNVHEMGSRYGWRSNELPPDGEPAAWSTAAVCISLFRIRRLVARVLNDVVLNQFNARPAIAPDRTAFGEHEFYDADLPDQNGNNLSLKETVIDNFVEPRLNFGPAKDCKYSGVLFGPPGTAKTTIAKNIAKRLGWPFLYLQTSDFSSEGISRVTGKAKEIFKNLALLENTVILFDEVEEFVRDRDSEKKAESRLITTAMLSLIQELRSKRKVIFIVATNFLKTFDAAITRAGGRFDVLLLVAPPNKQEKCRMFSDELRDKELDEESMQALSTSFGQVVDAEYDAKIKFFAYSEWKGFVNSVADDLPESIDDNELDKWKLDLASEIDSREKGITIRKDLRKDFLDSHKFVRFHS